MLGLPLMAHGGCSGGSIMRTHVKLIVFLLVCTAVIPLCLCSGGGGGSKGDWSCFGSERRALLAIREGIYDRDGWLSSWKGQDCCRWRGVGCDNTIGHVVNLNLRYPYEIDENFSGPSKVNLSLLGLPHLKYLDLSMNDFNGAPIPEFIGSLTHLEYLNLSFAGFYGSIPRLLGNLSSLHSLDLGYNSDFQADDLLWLSGIRSLQYLDLSYTNLSKAANWLHEINLHPSLLVLRLADASLPNIPAALPHVNLTSVTMLDFSGNERFDATIPRWLFNISSLEHLNLAFCQFHGCPSIDAGDFSNLRVLDLEGNGITGVVPEALGNLSHLEYLDLYDNALTGNISQTLWNLRNLKILKYLDLSRNEIRGNMPKSIGIHSSMVFLDLSYNMISGEIPATIGNVVNLEVLNLGYNLIRGEIPKAIGNLVNLLELFMSNNRIMGHMPETMRKLQNLRIIDLSDNIIEGTIPRHLGSLCKLSGIDLSNNIIGGEITGLVEGLSKCTENKFDKRGGSTVGLTYFQMRNNSLNGTVPEYIGQLSKLQRLDLSLNSFHGTMTETHFANLTSIDTLNVSYNNLRGQLPALLGNQAYGTLDMSSNSFSGSLPNLNSTNIFSIDLSNNSFSGLIPSSFFGPACPMILSLSHNHINGSIPLDLCNSTWLEILDLSNNELSGGLPNCWVRSESEFLNSTENNINPATYQLQSLHLGRNRLSGEIPSFLRLCPLVILDLSENRFSGSIPSWIGESLQYLKVLSLHSNMFDGNIPVQISNLALLQVLDLAHNKLSGNIPPSFGNLYGMIEVQNRSESMLPNGSDFYYKESIMLTVKGMELEYTRTLSLVTSIDLAQNNLSGEIPEDLTELRGLLFLNLSENHFTGNIPQNIGSLRQLESLDLSVNNLSGGIPLTMSSLYWLSHLNLSDNNLSGRIPSGNQFNTFSDPSIYSGNLNLCGWPLPRCTDEKPSQDQQEAEGNEDGADMIWLYGSSVLGFIVGFWGIIATLILIQAIRIAYFQFIDKISDWVYVQFAINFARLKFTTIKSTRGGN